MEVEIRDAIDIRVTSRLSYRAIHELLREIVETPAWHRHLKILVTFQLTNDFRTEKGKAAEVRGNMVRKYGKDSTVAGFRFVVGRNREQSEEYLGVVFDPRRVVPGKWEAHKEHQREKSRRAHQRRMKERQAKGEVNGMEL